VYIENCDISGGWDNAIDFVAVQHGHVVGSRIHRAGDWAMYAKGGSANLTIAGNEIFDAGTGGFTAGQGTGFEFMVDPYLTFEASDIRFVHNVVHDTQGAGFGVNGGSNILIAHNTLYRVGARSHVIEVVHGSRSCDGDAATCSRYLAAGGWGTNVPGGDEPIPNENVFILNNVVLNPEGYASQWQHLAVAEPVVVAGAPTIRIVIGSTTRLARFSGGSGTSTLTFSYTIARKDRDTDGITVFDRIRLPAGAHVRTLSGAAVATAFSAGDATGIRVEPPSRLRAARR